MTPLQKIIKYGAIAFGFYLMIIILKIIICTFMAIFGISVGIDMYKEYNTGSQVTTSTFKEVYEDVNSLDIRLDVSKLNIKNGNEFKVEVTNPTNNFYCKMDGDTLKIRDERSGFHLSSFDFMDKVIPEIVIYIPENQKFDYIDIEAGISDIYIEKLVANEFDIQTGVGKCTIDNILADIANINGGAGDTNIQNSTLKKLKLEAGVGKFVINSEISQEGKIEAGVGQLIINLKGKREDYKVKTSTGIGNLLVDGIKAGDNQVIGNGSSYIKVEAGVGEVQVKFLDNNI